MSREAQKCNLLERVFPRTPITLQKGRQPTYLVESDPNTVQKFRDERKLLLSTEQTSTPLEPTRNPPVPTKKFFFPIQRVEIHER